MKGVTAGQWALLVTVVLVALGCGGSGWSTDLRNPEGGSSGAGPGAVAGRVVRDSSGKIRLAYGTAPAGSVPLSGVALSIGSLTQTSGTNGEFLFNGVPQGSQTLRVTPPGGTPFTQLLTVIPGATIQTGDPKTTRTSAFAKVADILNAALPTKGRAGVTAPAWMAVYQSQQPIPAGTVLRPGIDDNSPAITVSSASWLVYVDQEPVQRFGHVTNFYLVDAESGAVEIHEEQSWPRLNDVSFYSPNFLADTSPDLVQVPIPNPAKAKINVSTETAIARTRTANTAKTYALIVIGGPKDEGFFSDVDNVQPLFGSPSVPPTAVQEVVKTETLGSEPVPYIQSKFEALANQAKQGDTFVLYISSHGIYDKRANKYWVALSYGLGHRKLFTTDFDFSKIKACNIVIMVDTCYSGNWQRELAPILPSLKGKHVSIVSAVQYLLGGYGQNPEVASFPQKPGGPFTILFTQAISTLPTKNDFDSDMAQAFASLQPIYDKMDADIYNFYHSSHLTKRDPVISQRVTKPEECCPCGGEDVGIG